MHLPLSQIARWTQATGCYNPASIALGYSIDSRTIVPGELFFAVVGERVDGHDYIQAALDHGAIAAVVREDWTAPESIDSTRLLRVSGPDDAVLIAMQTVAREVRRAWGRRVIGVTGSAGKTTTKEMVATVLAAKSNVLKTTGNLNNHFGVPLQLLRLQPEHEVAVIEMGMNHAGEIAALCAIAEPDLGVVSNVGPVHLEFFADGIDGIARAKKELVDALPSGGLAFLNADDARVRAMGGELGERAVLYGCSPDAAVRAEEIVEAGLDGVRFTAVVGAERQAVALRMLGRHNVLNALAAIAVGLRSGMTLAECAVAVGELRATEKRGSVIEWRGAKIVNDCYNSNPAALDAMVDALMAMPARRRIVVAGEMLELGPAGPELHRACGLRMRQKGVDVVVGVRGLARELGGAFFDSPQDAGAWMAQELREGDVMLLKASRGVRLEQALESLGAAQS